MIKFTNSPDLVSCSDIAVRLGVISEKGRPHYMLIGAVLTHLGIRPVARAAHAFLYKPEAINKLRQWFYEQVGDIDSDRTFPVDMPNYTYYARFLAVTKRDRVRFASKNSVA